MISVYRRFFTLLISSSLFFFSACSKEEVKDNPVKVAEGILFVGVDVGYTSSSLYALDLKTKVSTPVLPGQSGDFVLFQDEGRVFGFNRRADNLNMREIKADKGTFTFGDQISLPSILTGDPQDIALLNESKFLATSYGSHAVHVINLQSGKLQQTLEADWDLPGDVPLFPSEILRLGGGRFAILHQGYSSEKTAQGTIFQVEWDGTTLAAIDQDEAKPGVQGHVLRSYLPSGFFSKGDGTFLVPGLCADWVAPCESSFEIFDPEEKKLEKVLASFLDQASSYGAFISAGPNDYFGQIKRTQDGSKKAVLAHFDLSADTLTNVLNYSDVNGDSFEDTGLLAFDPEGNLLFVGRPTSDKAGIIHIFKDDLETDSIPTPAIPKQGLLLTGTGFGD